MTFFRGGPRGAPPKKKVKIFVPKVNRYRDRKSQKKTKKNEMFEVKNFV